MKPAERDVGQGPAGETAGSLHLQTFLSAALRDALHSDVLMATEIEGGFARGNAPSVAGARFPELREGEAQI